MPVGKPQTICGAKTRKGAPCRQRPMRNGRCKMHGGLTPAGIANPNTTHGRYSKHLPTRLADRYHEARSDPDLIALREEIALTDARLADLLGRVDTHEAGTRWKAVGAAVRAYRKAEAGEEDDDREKAFDLIEELTSEGLADYEAWDEVHRMVEQRRKLAETETKRLDKAGRSISAERAMLLVAAVVEVIRSHVQDRDTLAAISRDVGRLTAG